MEIDVVCGMEVDPTDAPETEHDGKLYYFCSRDCLEEFQRDPAAYAARPEAR
jgi:YHS domain-containing protein